MSKRSGSTPYLDLTVAERAKYVYRVISLKRLLELFQKRQNVLVAPEKWDDPFENFILKSGRSPRLVWAVLDLAAGLGRDVAHLFWRQERRSHALDAAETP